MTYKPKISVVMSVYNGEKYLRGAIESILNQTFKDFEFIIINDGSIDRTSEILESYDDPRIILVYQEHLGLTKSLNKGITLAKGTYIARQDADDISLPERLEKQIEFLEKHKNVALLGTAANIIDERGFHFKTIEFPCDYSSIRKGMKKFNHFVHGSVMFKRQCFFEAGGYRELFPTAQDYDLWLRFVEKYKAVNLSTHLYGRRINPSSVSLKKFVLQTRMQRLARQLADAREKEMNEFSLIKELKIFLKSPILLEEKKEIIQRYVPFGLLLLHQNKKNEAISLIEEIFKYHPSRVWKLLFRLTKGFRSSFLLKLLIRLSLFFNWLKK